MKYKFVTSIRYALEAVLLQLISYTKLAPGWVLFYDYGLNA